MKVTIQIAEKGKEWNQTPIALIIYKKGKITRGDQKAIRVTAESLSLLHNTVIRTAYLQDNEDVTSENVCRHSGGYIILCKETSKYGKIQL